jgi:hypothetical protein
MDPEQLPLRDLHLPDAVGWWPLAPGWWFLIALAAAGFIYLLYKQYLAWRWNAARRLALSELRRIRTEYEAGADALTLAKELSELVRRSMLAYAPRGEMAGLTGDAWLEWLDRGLDEKPFTSGPGRHIESLPYQRPEKIDEETDISGLIDAVKLRLRTPLPEGTR